MYGIVEGSLRVFTGVARKRKRCPHCRRMVEAGEPAVFRSFRPIYLGWQRGGFIGTSAAKFPTTHAYHESCAREAPEFAGNLAGHVAERCERQGS